MSCCVTGPSQVCLCSLVKHKIAFASTLGDSDLEGLLILSLSSYSHSWCNFPLDFLSFSPSVSVTLFLSLVLVAGSNQEVWTTVCLHPVVKLCSSYRDTNARHTHRPRYLFLHVLIFFILKVNGLVRIYTTCLIHAITFLYIFCAFFLWFYLCLKYILHSHKPASGK